jgi:ABC-type bacteriocin/lantibiotic exporter with double-glycine peptidase domain
MLMCFFRIVILDEATGQMDGHKKNKIIMPALRRFVREHNMALLMISHDMPSIADVDHIFVLEGGVLTCQGSHAELVAQGSPSYLRLLADTTP